MSQRIPHLLVLGFGPVAARLIDELLGEVTAGRLRLTVIGAETTRPISASASETSPWAGSGRPTSR